MCLRSASLALVISLFGGLLAPSFATAAEMETDRPDKTESSITVGRGHSQLEIEAASTTHSSTDADVLSIGQFEARFGLGDSSEIQIQFSPYLKQLSGGAKKPQSEGIGDTTIRAKFNVFGNSPDVASFAVLPYVKLPTAAGELGNGKVEGGVLLPMKIILPAEIEFAIQAGVAAMRNKDNTDEVSQFTSSYSIGHKVFGDAFDVYVEFYSETAAHADWVATVDTGVTYLVGSNQQLDAGVNIGTTPAADPWNPFVGYSVHF